MKEDLIIFLKENTGFKIMAITLSFLFSPASLLFFTAAIWKNRIDFSFFLDYPYWIHIFIWVVFLINASIGVYFANAFGESIKFEGTGAAIWDAVTGGTAIGIITGATLAIFFAISDLFNTDALIDAIKGMIIGAFIGAFIGLIIALFMALLWHLFFKHS